MSPAHFWSQKNDFAYDPICDIVIKVNGVLIVIEAKRDNVDCTAQLYNQAYNICAKNEVEFGHENVVAHDLNWNKLMELAVKVYSFEKATSVPNRFLKDLIDLVKLHNFRWLPEASIYSLSPDNTNGISRRIDSAINELCKAGNYDKLDYPDRLGLRFKKPWAQEILFSVNKTGDLDITIYPGNTKAQGEFIFHNDPKLKKEFDIGSNSYELNVDYHIKLTSFQKFFTGLWFNDDDLKSNLYTKENFWHYCGRNKRDEHWVAVENLFDTFFEEKYNWRSKCHWQEKVIESGRNQFDLSFGYEISIQVPFEELRKVDRSKSDLSGLTNLIESAYREFEAIYTV